MTKKSIEEEFKLKPVRKDRSLAGNKKKYSLKKIMKYTKNLERVVVTANDSAKA
jgi:hypothetical protein